MFSRYPIADLRAVKAISDSQDPEDPSLDIEAVVMEVERSIRADFAQQPDPEYRRGWVIALAELMSTAVDGACIDRLDAWYPIALTRSV